MALSTGKRVCWESRDRIALDVWHGGQEEERVESRVAKGLLGTGHPDSPDRGAEEGGLVALTESRWIGRVVVAATLALLTIAYARAAFTPAIDFGAYYGAALNLRAGRSLYDDALAWKAAGYATGSPRQQPTKQIAYVYPPTLALALLPFTALPLQAASAIWLALLFACVLATAWCLATLVTTRRDTNFWLLFAGLTLAFTLFKPVRGALMFSKQVDPLIMLLLAAMLLAFLRRRDGSTAVLLGLAITIKPFVVLLALLLLWKGAYRAVIGAGIVSAGLVFGPLLALGLVGDFLEATFYWAGTAQASSPVSQSAYSFLLRTLTVQPYTVPLVDAPWLVTPLRVLIGVALIAGLLATISRSRNEPAIVLLLEFGLVVTAMLIFGPLTEENHLAYLTIGLTATMAAGLSAWRASAGARWITVATATLVLFFMLPRTQVIAWGLFPHADRPLAPPLSFVTFLFLYALLATAVLNLAALRLLHRHGSGNQPAVLPA